MGDAPLWWPRVKRAEVISGEGLDRRQRLVMDWGRQEGIVEQVVTQWEPPRRYAWQVASEHVGDRVLPPLARTTITIEITSEKALARVRITGEWEPSSRRGLFAVRQFLRLGRITFGKALGNLEDALAPR